jgi:hypothetical protein
MKRYLGSVFFEPLPPDPSDVTSGEHGVPDWDQPPAATFSGVIPVQEVIAAPRTRGWC